MNAMLTPVRSLDQDRQHAVDVLDDHTRLSPFDRLSLRIGLRLMLRAERIDDRRRDHQTRTLALANARDISDRERHVEHDARLALFR
jgi:hypothetical protein